MTNNNMNSPLSRPEIFSLLAVTAIAAILVHQPATVYCADGGIYSSQQQKQQQQAMLFTAPSGYYISTYDHLDVGNLLRNPKVVSSFLRCFVNDGPCTADGKLVKAYLLPEMIRTVCGKCTPRQKDMVRTVLRHIYTYRRADFDKIMQIYDTDNKKNDVIHFMNQS